MKKIKAFTLAEVLLTLSIIGVIAAVTIPTINSSNQDKKYLALTKKALATLQGATDAKIALTSTVPRNDNTFFGWLTSDGASDEDTLKVVFATDNTAITPDGMAFCADIEYIGGDRRFKNEGYVYVDLNGAEGPTQTTSANVDELNEDSYNDPDNFDVIRFWVDREGTFVANDDCEKTREYLGIN